MAQSIREVMTESPELVSGDTTVVDAAKLMRDKDFGGVLCADGEELKGFLTDRDIAIRAVAEGRDPSSTTVGEIASRDLTTLSPNDSVDDAVRMMRERAVRRLPVVEGGQAVGIVSIGDLAIERDPDSALADISAAPPNE